MFTYKFACYGVLVVCGLSHFQIPVLYKLVLCTTVVLALLQVARVSLFGTCHGVCVCVSPFEESIY